MIIEGWCEGKNVASEEEVLIGGYDIDDCEADLHEKIRFKLLYNMFC